MGLTNRRWDRGNDNSPSLSIGIFISPKPMIADLTIVGCAINGSMSSHIYLRLVRSHRSWNANNVLDCQTKSFSDFRSLIFVKNRKSDQGPFFLECTVPEGMYQWIFTFVPLFSASFYSTLEKSCEKFDFVGIP
jgi:hypothetical protein